MYTSHIFHIMHIRFTNQ